MVHLKLSTAGYKSSALAQQNLNKFNAGPLAHRL
jgi:hypothetical protein